MLAARLVQSGAAAKSTVRHLSITLPDSSEYTGNVVCDSGTFTPHGFGVTLKHTPTGKAITTEGLWENGSATSARVHMGNSEALVQMHLGQSHGRVLYVHCDGELSDDTPFHMCTVWAGAYEHNVRSGFGIMCHFEPEKDTRACVVQVGDWKNGVLHNGRRGTSCGDVAQLQSGETMYVWMMPLESDATRAWNALFRDCGVPALTRPLKHADPTARCPDLVLPIGVQTHANLIRSMRAADCSAWASCAQPFPEGQRPTFVFIIDTEDVFYSPTEVEEAEVSYTAELAALLQNSMGNYADFDMIIIDGAPADCTRTLWCHGADAPVLASIRMCRCERIGVGDDCACGAHARADSPQLAEHGLKEFTLATF